MKNENIKIVEDLDIIVTIHIDTKSNKVPYYELKYKPVGDDEYRIGYGSYDLNQVCRWLEEEFILIKPSRGSKKIANRIKNLEKENARLLSLLANYRDVGLKYTTYCSGMLFTKKPELNGAVPPEDFVKKELVNRLSKEIINSVRINARETSDSIRYTAYLDVVERENENETIS